MKKLLLLLALMLPALVHAQIDIPVAGRATFFDVGRSLNWTGSGQGNINNNFVITFPAVPTSPLCVYITNNDVGTHTLNAIANAQITADPRRTTFTGANAAWINSRSLGYNGSGGNITSIAAGTTAGISINAQGALRTVLSLSGGSGSGTADIFAVQGGCSGAIYNTFAPNTIGGSFPTLDCDKAVTNSVAAGVSVVFANGVSGAANYVCSVLVQTSATITTVGAVNLQSSTSQNACTGPVNIDSFFPNSAVGAVPIFVGGNLGARYVNIGNVNTAICVTNNSTGGSVQVTLTIGQL